MSRAYRIQLSESLQRHLKVEDGFKAGLDILDVLPRENMAALLREELARRGFEETEDGIMVRIEEDGTEVSVNPADFTATVRRAAEEDLNIRRDGIERSYTPNDADATERLRKRLQSELETGAEERRQELQTEVTDALEQRLIDLRPELDAVSHTVVATALKQKAASLGEIREIDEDVDAGTLTIRIEV